MVAGQSSSSIRDSAWRWARASIICVVSLLAGCSSGGELPTEVPDDEPPPTYDPSVLRLPFVVDDHFVPNGCFGDGFCQGDVVDIDSRGCQDRPARVQGACRLFTYRPLAPGAPDYKGFLGILFQDVGPLGESEIGRVPGLPVEPGAKRVVFWAKVGSGLVEVSFHAGGANNWDGDTNPSLPYKDDFGVPADVTLNEDYQQLTIDLSGVTYEKVVSPFGWAITSNGRTEPIELFVADVRWE